MNRNTLYKLAGVLIILASVFASGVYYGKGQVQIIERKGEEKIVYRDKIITRIKIIYPDGTTEEKVIEEDRQGEKTKKESGKEQKPILAQYMLGVGYAVHYRNPLDTGLQRVLELQASTRLVGPIWVNLGVRRDSATLGVALEFQ